MMMKNYLDFALILAALAVVTMGVVGFPKIDVNILRPLYSLFSYFAFFTLENLLKRLQEYVINAIAFMNKCDLRFPQSVQMVWLSQRVCSLSFTG